MSALQQAQQTYLDHLAVERGRAANTLSSYRRDLRRYLAHLAGRDIDAPDAVGEADVSAFLVALREGDDEHPPLAANSAARAVVAVRGFHRFLLREGLVTVDAARGVRPPSPPKRLPKAISVQEVEPLLAAAGADETPRALRDRALLELLYGCGARISEAGGAAPPGLAAPAAALVRHPPARRRRRRPGRPGAAGARQRHDHPGLHAGHGRPAARGLRHLAPPRPLIGPGAHGVAA